MLTPGAAGGTTMLIATALSNNFGLSASNVGLALSFLFGLLVLANSRKIWIKGVYYLLNSLIIFCIAFGTNTLVTAKTPVHHASLALGLIPSAFAQTNNSAQLQTLHQALVTLQAQYQDQANKLATLKASNAPPDQISSQTAALQQIQGEISTNLNAQNSALATLTSQASPPAANTATGASYFKPWSSPF